MRGGRDGFIVVSVLVVLALLTGLVGAIGLAVRSEVDAASAAREQIRLEGLTQAAVALVAHELYTLRRPASRVDGREIRLDDGVVLVRVEDEAGKVDLNGAEPILLAGLYRAAGLEDLDPETFAAEVVAWRLRLPPDPGVRDRREPGFRSIAELRWLPGLSASEAAILSDFVTVHNPSGKIAPASAPVTVLRALPGLAPQALDAVLRLREAPTPRLAEDLGALLRAQQGFLATKSGRCFRILLDASTQAHARRRVRLTTVKAAVDHALFYTNSYETIF